MHRKSYYIKQREQRKAYYKIYDGHPLATCFLHLLNIACPVAACFLFIGGISTIANSHSTGECIIGVIEMIGVLLAFLPILIDKIIQKLIG